VNIFQNLKSLTGDAEPEQVSDEQAAAEARAERIKFHRAHVRNGPVNFKGQSNGQAKRERRRELAGRTRKARRKQVRDFLAQQREHAILRGHLQAIGVVAYETDFDPSVTARFESARWVLNNFGSSDILTLDKSEGDYLRDAVQAAFDRFADISGVERSEVEYA